MGGDKRKTIAIIGASTGQRMLYVKAKEMGLRTIAFAWENGAICKDLADKFYPISILETDRIVEICQAEKIIGVVSNGSNLTEEQVSKIATILGLHGIPYDSFLKIKDKSAMRSMLANIEELSQVWNYIYDGLRMPDTYPCVIKPSIGGGKKGVSIATTEDEFKRAIEYARNNSDDPILVEQFVPGQEVSVEAISFEGRHLVIQITDKENTGAPHFVETGHHQPSMLPVNVKDKIKRIIPRILDKINFCNGPSHTEMIITAKEDIYLVEVNPRGGGDEISNTLTQLSTGYDYVKSMIDVATGDFIPSEIRDVAYSGIYYLCLQTQNRLCFFKNADGKDWLVRREIKSYDLQESTTNYDRNGFIIYKSDRKILVGDASID